MSTDTPGARRVRTSDAEREALATILRAAMTEGRLTLQEGEERLAKAYAATYRDELGPLTTDLPDGGRDALFDTPQAKAEADAARRHLRGHIGVVVAMGAALVGLWALSGAHFFWPAIPLVFLFFGVVRHARHQRWHRYLRHAGPRWGGGGGWPATGGWGPQYGSDWGPPWARKDRDHS
jgi:hypothetical protein